MSGHLLLQAVQSGGYVSILAAVLLLLLLLAWARMLTWADKDAIAAHLPRIPLNIGMVSGMAVAYAIFFFLPLPFFAAFVVPLLVFLIEVGIYLAMRNKSVGLGDLSKQFADWRAGFRKEKETQDATFRLTLMPKNGPAVPTPAKETPDRAMYEAVQHALTDPMVKGAEQVDLVPSSSGMTVKYTVDGVGYTGPAIESTIGAGAVGYLKGIGGMNVEEKRKPQTGAMKIGIDGQKKDVKLQSAGSTAGEYLRMMVNPDKRHNLTLDQLGMTERQLEAVRESIKDGTGVVLLAAPKGQGLTSMLYAVMRAHDAYLQHLQTLEHHFEHDMEGITQNKLAANSTPEDEAKQVDWLVSQEPDVVMIDRVDDPRTAATLIRFGADKRAYVGLRAGGTAEAIEQWRKIVGDDASAIEQLKLVVAGRIVRRLCMACKESYAPDPNTLRKLGMSPDRVTALFKAREEPMRDPKGNPVLCTFCHELRFNGRMGVFELLTVDDDVRAALRRDFAAGGRIGSQFKAAFRKQRAKYLQEEALAIVERGDTSVQEVLRALKGGEDDAPRSSSSGGGSDRPRAAARPRSA